MDYQKHNKTKLEYADMAGHPEQHKIKVCTTANYSEYGESYSH